LIPLFPFPTGYFQVRVGQEGERDVAIPGGPFAHLVLVQFHHPFDVCKALLDGPAHPGHPHQLGERCLGWAKRSEVRSLGGLTHVASDEQPLRHPGCARVRQVEAGPIAEPRSLTPRTTRERAPRLSRQCGDEGIGPLLLALVPDGVAAGDGQDIRMVRPLQPAPEIGVSAVDFIAGHPGGRHRGGKRSRQHAESERRLGGKVNLLRHPGCSPWRGIVCPLLRQVQLAVEEGASLGARLAQEDPELAVLPPAVPLYCRCTPTDFVPFFRKPVSSTMRTPAGSPRCAGRPAPLWPRFAQVFGQLPAILALDPIQQPGQIALRPRSGFRSPEPASNPGMQRIQPRPPALDLFVRRHDPLRLCPLGGYQV
jgi:hypothetical protein